MAKIAELALKPFAFNGHAIRVISNFDSLEELAMFDITDLTYDINDEDASYSAIRLLGRGLMKPVDAITFLSYEYAFSYEMHMAAPEDTQLQKQLKELDRLLDKIDDLFDIELGEGATRVLLEDKATFIELMLKIIPKRQAAWDRFLAIWWTLKPYLVRLLNLFDKHISFWYNVRTNGGKNMRQLASIKEITEVQPIENADAIEVVVIENGWQCVAKKGEFALGDKAVAS